jgi:hypothetical protein
MMPATKEKSMYNRELKLIESNLMHVATEKNHSTNRVNNRSLQLKEVQTIFTFSISI